MKRAALGALLLLSGARGQTQSFCEGELGQAGWDCGIVAPLPAQVGGGGKDSCYGCKIYRRAPTSKSVHPTRLFMTTLFIFHARSFKARMSYFPSREPPTP